MRKIKWGVMGTAFICERSTFPGMLQAENCEMYAIAGRNMEKAERFKETYGFQKAYGSYEKLLADPKVEAVYIPLPNTMHYEWTIRALKSGKHVLCEKPLAPTEAQAEEMFKAAEENHVYLMEAFAYQHSPYIAAVRKEIENGTIGDVRYMESAYITSDYDPKNIRMRRDTLGGCTYDLGVYNTSLILRILGDEPAKVRAIASFSEEKIDTLTSFDGREEMKTISVPQNYRLEVEQMGRCVEGKETPAVTRGFSLANARMIDAILEEIGY
ncbi:Gfo/Idh/MocA family protein [Blautia obeum]|nr:Gfo/Idh/MocA family oxidoreductase [Blautia obeum]